MFTSLIKHAHVVGASLGVFISLVIPTLVFSHTISLGDCSLFSKGNVKVPLRHATKFLQVNRKKLSQLLCGCSRVKAKPFLSAGLFAFRTRAQELLFTENSSCFAAFRPPTSSSPQHAFPCCRCPAADVRIPRNAEQTLRSVPQPTGANEPLGSGPTPTRLQTSSPALLTAKGKDDGSSCTALVITAEIISVSVYLPGIATGTYWQHPVVSERELPHKSFPMLPHSSAIQSVRPSLLAGRSFLDIEKGPGLSWHS